MREAWYFAGVAAAALAVAGIGGVAAETDPDAAAASDSRRVMAFMYLWYGDASTNYSHWDHEVLPHWTDAENEKYKDAVGKRFAPPHEIHAPFWPRRGLYRSDDPKVLSSQMEEMRSAGIGVAVISWWGRPDVPGTHDTQGVSTDAAVPAVLEAAAKQGMSVAFHLEPYEGRTAETVAEDVAYIRERYGSHPAVFRSTKAALADRSPAGCAASVAVPQSEGGEPVFFVYDSYHVSPTDWASVLVAPGALAGKGVFLGLVLEHRQVSQLAQGGFDGGYPYFATNGFSFGSTTANWATATREMTANGLVFVPSVAPGYDDRRIRPWNGRVLRLRAGGAYYESMWRAAIAASGGPCAVVSITSYNEFGEGTNIESSVPHTVERGQGIEGSMREALGNAGSRVSQDFGETGPFSYLAMTRAFAARVMGPPVRLERPPSDEL